VDGTEQVVPTLEFVKIAKVLMFHVACFVFKTYDTMAPSLGRIRNKEADM